MPTKLAPTLFFLLSLICVAANAEGTLLTSWKFHKDQDNKCVARNVANPAFELMAQKLTITTKETVDLKTFQVSVNDQVVIPMNRVSLTDSSCKCIRIRNMNALASDDLNIRIQGQTTSDKAVDITLNAKDIASALQALKSDVCKKS
jgi:predicted transport protein